MSTNDPTLENDPGFDVDAIVAVHTATRPIHRAVLSILDGTTARVRATVVAHNIDPEVIEGNLAELLGDDRVRVLHLADGIGSPAGPMNHALDHATAPYFTLLGSDDELAPGAIDGWLALARETGASTVLARIERDIAGLDPYPPTRHGRTTELDPVKDRLSYRSAPLGLVSRTHFPDLRFTPDLASGEDLEFTATLWFTGTHIAFARDLPGYVGHEDGTDRISFDPRPVRADFAFLDAIEATPWFPGLSRRERVALAVKTVRIHIFDAVLARLNARPEDPAWREQLIAVVDRLETWGPGTRALLSRADRHVLDLLRDPGAAETQIRLALDARWVYRSPSAMLPRNPLRFLHRQAPFRTLLAAARSLH